MRVLIVDDDPTSMKVISTILRKNGYEIARAESGREAIELLGHGKRIDIIISDVNMPVMDGFHLLAYLKVEPRYRDLPVLLCSALGDEKSVIKGISLGAADYVAKPVEAEMLLAKVKRAERLVSGAILIVDDEELLRGLLEKILHREGFKTITASSGLEALDLLASNHVVLVISDIKMPQMSGLELTVAIKEKDPSMPILLMTSHDNDYHRNDVLDVGADGYIVKPFKNTEIVRRVKPLLNRDKSLQSSNC